MLNECWKKFADDTPTERRSVVVFNPLTDTGALLVPDGVDVAWETDGGNILTAGDWHSYAETVGVTHWLYLDPPEAT